MSDIDDEVKETKATKFQRILDKLELIERAVNKLNEDKPKPVKKKLMDKDSDAYKNKRSVYVNKLNNKDIKSPKKETLEYYESLTTKREHIRHCISRNTGKTKIIMT